MERGHPEEWLDIVDDNDQPVGRALRGDIHRDHLPHRAAHLMVRDGDGRFLLQKRSASRPTHPGLWDCSAAGHVLSGDSYEETIHREAAEEIGLALESPPPVLHLEPTEETGWEWIGFFAVRVENDIALKPDPVEVAAVAWWTEKELIEALVSRPEEFTPAFQILFFLWRETGFVLPEMHQDDWHTIAWGNANQLHVQRSMLEGAGFEAHVVEDQHWLVGSGSSGFFSRRDPVTTCLVVPRESLCEAVALLYLSRPETDGE